MEWYWWFLIFWFGISILICIGLAFIVAADDYGIAKATVGFFFSPIIIIVFIVVFTCTQIEDLYNERQRRKKELREQAHWWQLKEFGGKF